MVEYPFKTKKKITSTFEDHKNRKPPSTAPGTDFAAKTGTAILSPITGIVKSCYWRNAGGRSLWIQGNGIRAYVAHMSQVAKLMSEEVKSGDKIGEVGSTGNSTGPHLHLSIQIKNKRGVYAWIDPETLL